MQRIDAHQHFWKYDPVRDSWITEAMSAIKNDFLPAELETILKENKFDGCVAVQASQSELENDSLLLHAEKYPFIKGVVGWVDLQGSDIEERLEYYSEYKKMKGFRHILQGESRRDLMLKKEFKRGISLLHKYNFTYDILIFPDQLQYVEDLATEFPGQKFVIDHLAKPYIKFKKIGAWKDYLKRVAEHENVFCKISGFVTEADWQVWTKDDFKPYFDIAVEAFGVKRMMFGSDWPVCLVAAKYSEVVDAVQNYFAAYSKTEQDQVFGLNAIDFYHL